MTENEIVRQYEWLVDLIASDYYLATAENADLRQEALLGLLSAIRSYDPTHHVPFKLFAGYCIRRRVFTALKRARRQKHGPLNNSVRDVDVEGELVPIIDVLPDVRSDPADVFALREEVRVLLTAIGATLTSLERRCLLRSLAGDEIADKSADNALQRARRKLRAAA